MAIVADTDLNFVGSAEDVVSLTNRLYFCMVILGRKDERQKITGGRNESYQRPTIIKNTRALNIKMDGIII